MNLHAFRHTHLKRTCIPVSPPGLEAIIIDQPWCFLKTLTKVVDDENGQPGDESSEALKAVVALIKLAFTYRAHTRWMTQSLWTMSTMVGVTQTHCAACDA